MGKIERFNGRNSFVKDGLLFCHEATTLGIGVDDYLIYRAIRLNSNILSAEMIDGLLTVTAKNGQSISFRGEHDELESLQQQIEIALGAGGQAF